jgi:hypothetical protein
MELVISLFLVVLVLLVLHYTRQKDGPSEHMVSIRGSA